MFLWRNKKNIYLNTPLSWSYAVITKEYFPDTGQFRVTEPLNSLHAEDEFNRQLVMMILQQKKVFYIPAESTLSIIHLKNKRENKQISTCPAEPRYTLLLQTE